MLMPKFFKSPYFVMETDNWHLLPGAPKEIQEEFDEFMSNPDCVIERPQRADRRAESED